MQCIGKKYTEAIEFYTKAIDLASTVASYYGNRSIAYLRTEAFGYALQDASKSLEVDKNYIKVGMCLLCAYVRVYYMHMYIYLHSLQFYFDHLKICRNS